MFRRDEVYRGRRKKPSRVPLEDQTAVSNGDRRVQSRPFEKVTSHLIITIKES